MSIRSLLLVILGLVAVVIGPRTVFVVKQWEQAVVFQFREIDRTDLGPGLYFMIPFVNSVQKFERRLLTLDQDPQRFLTQEKKFVIVDYYVKWRIINASNFYRATTGDLLRANRLLAQRINSTLRDEFGKRTVQEVIAGERGEIMNVTRETVSELPDELGILVEDVRTMRIDFPEDVNNAIYNRMRSERERVAKDFRARGEEAAERIRAEADREHQEIVAEAYRKAELVRGEGDAESTRIYAEAYSKDEEFYALYRSLNAYRNSFHERSDVLLLSPDSSFFDYFKDPGPN